LLAKQDASDLHRCFYTVTWKYDKTLVDVDKQKGSIKHTVYISKGV